MKLSVVIPAYNESEGLLGLLKDIDKELLDYEKEIIVVDDGSREKISDWLEHGLDYIKLIRHPYNIGNGAAVKSGIRASSGDWILLMDADSQHPPKEITKLLKGLGSYDMVVGSRVGHRGSWHRNIANRIFNSLASYVTATKIVDLTSGFRLIRADLCKRFLYLLPNGFSYPTTLTLALLKTGRSIKFQKVEMLEREQGSSKINILKDGIKFILIIVKIATIYSPFKVFLPISFIFFITGLIYYIYTYINWHSFTNMSLLLFSTSVIIFLLSLIAEQIAQLFVKDRE
ncbi:MAG: glycosyltransferase family 2 protein [Candidatus Kaelpia aquatica]|nr:glycosyltransferase family 2 protein [Candidatus Kaelpia aquatica]